MMLGTCRIKNGTIITSKTSYVVTQETRPDVRRIFLAPALIIGTGLSLFTMGFVDLLKFQELLILGAAIGLAALAGSQFARLTILDRVTRGTEQMSAIYGLHTSLQQVRGQIDAVIFELKEKRS